MADDRTSPSTSPSTITLCPTDNDTRPPPSQSTTGTSTFPRPHLDKQTLEYALRSGLAGGLAGCAAKTTVAPLDRIKILFQTRAPSYARYSSTAFGFVPAIADVYHTSGVRGLFRGHSATLLRIFPYAAVKFIAYEQVRAVLIRGPSQETAGRRMLSGSAAGVASVLLTYPLEVIRVRMAFETKPGSHGGGSTRLGLREICRHIYRETVKRGGSTGGTVVEARTRGGLTNFYRGFAPTLLGMLPYAGTSFLTHDTLGDLLRDPRIAAYTSVAAPPPPPPSPHTSTFPSPPSQPPIRPRLKSWAELLSGAGAGLLSQTASYPLEVLRRRMQVGGAVGDGHRLRMAETAGLIWRERGFRGFFAGLGVGYVKVVPMVAVSFWVYERGKLVLGI